MSRRWVRVYADILDDEKIDKMSAKTFKIFIFLLTYCAECGKDNRIIDSQKTLCWRFRISKKTYNTAIKELLNVAIISIENNNLIINKWGARQYKSDLSTDRVKRFRNVSETATETPPDTDTDTETDTYTDKKMLHEWFEKFWKNYPNKKDEENTWCEIQKLNPDNKLQEIIDMAIINQKKEKSFKEIHQGWSEHWPIPSKWIKNKRWKDEVQSEDIIKQEAIKPSIIAHANIAYELAVNGKYEEPAIYYAVQNIKSWNDKNLDESIKRSRFKASYSLVSKQLANKEIDTIDYDLFMNHYKNEYEPNGFTSNPYDNIYHGGVNGQNALSLKIQATNQKHFDAAKNILLVEDEPCAYKTIQYFLNELGYNVIIAKNAEEAIKRYKKASLIFIDIVLPKIDGFEICKRIKSKNQDIPIIGMTALKSDLLEKALDAGMVELYEKPLLQEDLKKILNKYLT